MRISLERCEQNIKHETARFKDFEIRQEVNERSLQLYKLSMEEVLAMHDEEFNGKLGILNKRI